LHGNLYAAPHQEWPEYITESIFNEVHDSLFPKAGSHKNSRYDEKKGHPETKEENIQELKHGMLIGLKNVCIG